MAIDLGPDGLTLGSTTINDWADVGGGKVLQVLQNSSNTQTVISSGSEANMTTQAITPSSTSSKILLIANTSIGHWSGTPNVRAWFRRGGTDLGTFTDGIRKGAIIGVELESDSEDMKNMSYAWLDSPNTTSSITYAVRVGTEDGAIIVNRIGSTSNSTWATRTYTMLTVMEIAG